MKNSLLSGALVASLLLSIAPVFAAPKAAPQTAATASAKKVDPLDIPAFAPIPNEFVFAGTQKDVYKLLSQYTGGISLADLPEPTEQERKEIIEKKGLEDNATLQALLDVKHILAPIHVMRVRSISYRALSDKEREKFLEDSIPKTQEAPKKSIEGSIESGITSFGDISASQRYDRERELLRNAETFYKDLMVKQGGKVQMQLRGETSISVYAFAQPQTFAVITSGPGRVIVARADGKPDVGAITGIFQRVVGGN